MAAGRGEQAALIHDSPVTGTVETLTYAELTARVARMAGALARLGVQKGDRRNRGCPGSWCWFFPPRLH